MSKENNKEEKVKTTKKKSKTSLGTKIFIWFMFIAMLSAFVLPLLYYIKSIS